MSAQGRRRWLGVLFAIGFGLALAWIDSRPGFDAVGITVMALVAAGSLAAIIAAARSLVLATLVGALVGIWIPIFEIGGSSGSGSLAAVVFAVAGALGGAAALRLFSTSARTA